MLISNTLRLSQDAFYDPEGFVVFAPESTSPQRLDQPRSSAPLPAPRAQPTAQVIDLTRSSTSTSTPSSAPSPTVAAGPVFVSQSSCLQPSQVLVVPNQTHVMNQPPVPEPAAAPSYRPMLAPYSVAIPINTPTFGPPAAISLLETQPPSTPGLAASSMSRETQPPRQTPGYGQLLTDPLNDPTAATEVLEAPPRQRPAWRGFIEGDATMHQQGVQPAPIVPAASTPPIPEDTAYSLFRRNLANAYPSRRPQATRPQRRVFRNPFRARGGFMSTRPSIQPTANMRQHGRLLAPAPGLPNRPDVQQQLGGNPASGLRAPTFRPAPTTAG